MSAFVTFEYSDGVNVMAEMSKNKGRKFTEISNPDDIKWEKRNWNYRDSLILKVKSYTVIVIIMTIIYGLIFKVRYET